MPAILKRFADEIAQKADVMLIGFAGGSVRNVVTGRPVESAADLKGMKIRVPGAPLWSEAFEAAPEPHAKRDCGERDVRRHQEGDDRGRRGRCHEHRGAAAL